MSGGAQTNDPAKDPAETVKVLICEDHSLVREGMAALIGSQPDLEIVALTADGADAVRLSLELKPDLVIMDLDLPEMSGLEAISRIRDGTAKDHEIPVLIVSATYSQMYLAGAIKVGAKGYLLKGAESEELFKAVREVSSGLTYYPQETTNQALLRPSQRGEPLANREIKMLQLIANGETVKESSTLLHVSEQTGDRMSRTIKEKLLAPTLPNAVAVALAKGLIRLPE